MDDDDELLV